MRRLLSFISLSLFLSSAGSNSTPAPQPRTATVAGHAASFYSGKTVSGSSLGSLSGGDPAAVVAACLKLTGCRGWMAAPEITDKVFFKGPAAEDPALWVDTPPLEDGDELTGLYLLDELMPKVAHPDASGSASASLSASLSASSSASSSASASAATLDAQAASNHWESAEVSGRAHQHYFLRLDYSEVLVDAEKGLYKVEDMLAKERAAKASARYWKDAVLHATAVQKKSDSEISKQRMQLAEEESSNVAEDDETVHRT